MPVLKLVSRVRSFYASTRLMRYVLSLVEQAFVSTLNLGTNLLLIRHLPPADYGLFVLCTNAALILCNLQASMTIAHLMTLPAGTAVHPGRALPERMILVMTLLLIALSVIGSVTALLVFDAELVRLPAALAVYLPALMLYAYTRSLAFSRGNVVTGTAQSGAVLVLAAVLLGGFTLAGTRPQVELALLILSLAYGATGLIALVLLCRDQFRRARLQDLMHFRLFWRESLWVLVGIGSIELLGRFNSVIVSLWFDTAAVGTLAATMLLLRPIGLTVSAWSLIGRMGMVERREAKDWNGFVRSVLNGLAGALLISIPWATAVYLAWPLISAHLFAGLYADDAWIVLLSGVSAVVGAVLAVLSLGFQSLRRFRTLAYTDMAGALVAVATTLMLLRLHFGFALSVVGMTTGQVLDVIFLGFLLLRLPSRSLKPAI